MRKQVVPLRVYCGHFVCALRELCVKMHAQTRLHATLRATKMARSVLRFVSLLLKSYCIVLYCHEALHAIAGTKCVQVSV